MDSHFRGTEGAKQRGGNTGSVRRSKFNSKCWRSLFSFIMLLFWYHMGLEMVWQPLLRTWKLERASWHWTVTPRDNWT